jgi:hypothetical protein
MILVTQKYRDPSRDKEFARCERLNESASVIDHIEAVDGESRRWTFGDLYGLCCEKFSGKLCVIANSDIAFDGWKMTLGHGSSATSTATSSSQVLRTRGLSFRGLSRALTSTFRWGGSPVIR